MISVSMTASFDANLAREVGIPAAILYNQLLYLSQTDLVKAYDKDGWFYYSSANFEERTTYTKNTYTQAVNALVDAGYIAKKRMYIKNSTISANHFQFLKYYVPNSQQMGIGEITPNGNCIYKENNKENKTGFLDGNPEPSPDPTSSLTEAEKRTQGVVVKNITFDKDPFGGEVKDVKPKKDMLTPKAFALASELMPIIDPSDKDKVMAAKLIKSALAKGYTPEELRYVARASRSDDWYYNKSCSTVLSREGIKTLLAKKKKKSGGAGLDKLTPQARWDLE